MSHNRRKSNKYTIDRYHINTMEIIIYIMSNKNFYAGIKLSLIGNFILQRKPFWIFDELRGLLKEINSKNWGLFVEKKGKR